jgi:hypothetical protein
LTLGRLPAEFRGLGAAPINKFGSEVSARKSDPTDDDRHQKIVDTHAKYPFVIRESNNPTSRPRPVPDEGLKFTDCFLMKSL